MIKTARELPGLAAIRKEHDAPSEAQAKAGNYRKPKVSVYGLTISIENPKGSVRRGVDSFGKPWSTTMKNDYGYFLDTEGADGDHVDVFLGPDFPSYMAFVVDQNHQDTGKFDEHKVMLGFKTKEDAKAAYLSNFQKDWAGFREITSMTIPELKKWMAKKTIGPAADFDLVKVARAAGLSVFLQLSAQADEDAMRSGRDPFSGRPVLVKTAGAPPFVPPDVAKRLPGKDPVTAAQIVARWRARGRVAGHLDSSKRFGRPGSSLRAESVLSAAEHAGIDPKTFAAITAWESGWGTSPRAKAANNFNGVMGSGSSLKKFPSVSAGLRAAATNLRSGYFDKGLKTPAAIGAKYAPTSGATNDPSGLNNNWVRGVTSLLASMPGR